MESLFLLLVLLFHEIFSQQCPPGYSALYNNNQLVTCSFNNVCSCQAIRPGYFCQYSSSGQNICCGVSATQCPSSSAILNTNGNGYQSCQSSSDCPTLSYCNQNVCCASPNAQCGSTGGGGNCANGQILVNGICMSQVPPGSNCLSTQQCTGGSQCTNGFCQCPNGAQPTSGQCQNSGTGSNGQCIFGAVLVNNQCISMTPPGSQCTNSQQCLDNSSCSFNFGTSGICTCTNNLQLLTGYRPYCVSSTNSGQCPNSQTVMVNGQCMQYSSLNGNCVSDVQCLGGSRCQLSTCLCPTNTQSLCFTNNGEQQCYCITPNSQNGQCQSGQVLVNGQCVTGTQIGAFCQSSQYCLGNSQCISGFCRCPSGTTQQGSQCIGGSNMNCNTNQVLINNQCYQTVPVGSYGCTFTQQCLGNSNCLSGMCQCPTGTVQQGSQCIGGNNGFCPSNQVMVNGQCLVSIGSFGCSFSLGCAGNAQCNSNGQCLCPSGTTQQGNQCLNGNNGNCNSNQVLVNDQCYQTVPVGYACTLTQQCLGNSNCLNGMCQCPTGTIQQGSQCIGGNSNYCPGSNQISMNNQCYTAYQPGTTGCSISASLSTCLDNSFCNNNQCVCQSNTQANQGYCLPQSTGFCGSSGVMINNQCFQLSRVDQQCTYDQQCLGGSNCLNSLCSCGQKTRFCMSSSSVSQACYCVTSSQSNQVPIGSYCSYGQSCAGNSTCLNSYCTCPQGTAQQGSQCVSQNSQMAAPGEYCYQGQQCLDGATCLQNNCTCSSGAFALYGYCLPYKTDSCSQTMVMVNGQCLSYTTYNGQCQVSQQCLGGTSCMSGRCQCSNNAQPTCINGASGQQCYCSSGASNGLPIGSFGCGTFQTCAGNAQCFNGQCLCPSGTIQQGSVCVNNAGCQNGQVSINGQCYPTYNPNNYGCTYPQQCLGNSQCYNSYCSCPSGTTLQNNQCMNSGGGSCKSYQVLINNQCMDTVGIGMQCQNQAQCTVANSMCSGTCVCSNGMTYNGSGCSFSNVQCPAGQVLVSNSCRSLVALNQACQVSAQCLGYGTCSSSFCQCMSGTTAVNGVCRSSTETGPCSSNQVLIGNQCYNTVPLRQSCMFSQQCQGNGTCQNSICACQSPAQDYGDGICRGSSSNGDLCSAGETPQYQNNQLINCLISACPSSSYCKYNSRYSQYVCCKPGSATLTCANPQYTVLYQNNQPVNCLMTTCPSNSICEYNSSSGQYVCCQAGGSSTSTCQGNYYTYPSGFPAVCTSDTFCSSSSPTYRYCRMAPGQTFSVCCDRS